MSAEPPSPPARKGDFGRREWKGEKEKEKKGALSGIERLMLFCVFSPDEIVYLWGEVLMVVFVAGRLPQAAADFKDDPLNLDAPTISDVSPDALSNAVVDLALLQNLCMAAWRGRFPWGCDVMLERWEW